MITETATSDAVRGCRRTGVARRATLEDVSRNTGSDRRVDRDPRGRSPRACRSERIREVDPDQDARRLPRPGPGCRRRAGRRAVRARSRGARRAPLRASGPRAGAGAERDGQPRAAGATSSGASAAAFAGPSRPRRPTGSSSASTSRSTSIARSPRRPRSSGRSSRSRARFRAGTEAVECSCSTSRPRCSPTTRPSGCSRWCARCSAAAPASSTSRTAWTRSSRSPTASRSCAPGAWCKTLPVAEVDHRGLAQLMVGAEVDPDYRAPVAARPDSPVVLELRDVRGRRLHGARPGRAPRRDPRCRRARRGRGERAAVRDRGTSTPSRSPGPSGCRNARANGRTSPRLASWGSHSFPPTERTRRSSRTSRSART